MKIQCLGARWWRFCIIFCLISREAQTAYASSCASSTPHLCSAWGSCNARSCANIELKSCSAWTAHRAASLPLRWAFRSSGIHAHATLMFRPLFRWLACVWAHAVDTKGGREGTYRGRMRKRAKRPWRPFWTFAAGQGRFCLLRWFFKAEGPFTVLIGKGEYGKFCTFLVDFY